MNQNTQFQKAKKLLLSWDLKTNIENKAAPLGVCYLRDSWDNNKDFDLQKSDEILLSCSEKYMKKNLQWGDVNKLVRGKKELAISGGPDILRAIYGIPYKSNKLKAVAGDGLVIFVKWDKNGNQTTKSIHQYGNSEDQKSPHYDDQMELFTQERFKETFFLTSELSNNLAAELNINVVR